MMQVLANISRPELFFINTPPGDIKFISIFHRLLYYMIFPNFSFLQIDEWINNFFSKFGTLEILNLIYWK